MEWQLRRGRPRIVKSAPFLYVEGEGSGLGRSGLVRGWFGPRGPQTADQPKTSPRPAQTGRDQPRPAHTTPETPNHPKTRDRHRPLATYVAMKKPFKYGAGERYFLVVFGEPENDTF